MPGTIQVTVLEFKGVSNSSKPSAKSLKVSMGKRQYQTWDKGEFSFPISKLREDLVVTLLDAGGNEIAHADIRTMQIIEKGSWDEVFSINGGGNVHMKLQFILSEEERDRIRIMRESAMKKKLETNPKTNLKLSETVSSTRDSVETSTKKEQKLSDSQKGIVEIDALSSKSEASQAGSSSNSATSFSVSQTVLQTAIPNTTDGSQSAPSSPPRVHQRFFKTAFSEKNSLVPSNSVDPVSKNPQKSPSNVRKMISAFENTQIQEVKSLKKAQSVPSQLNRFRKEGLLDNRESKAIMHAENTSSRNFNDNLAGNSKWTPVTEKTGIVSNVRGEKDSNILDTSEEASRERTSETATSSGRITEEEISQGTVNSSSSFAEGSGSGIRGTGLKSSSINEMPKSLESYHSAQSSGMWIFPDNTRRLCITTAGRKITGHQHSDEAKTRQENKVSSEPKGLDKKNIGSGPDDSSNGLVRQVIKIAVVVGFGVLVLLTRQKEPRKQRREENDNLFPIPDYVD